MSYEEIWKSQPVELPKVDIDRLVRDARRFDRRITIRNWMEWGASILVFPLLVLMAASPMPLLSRVSAGFLALTVVFVSLVILRYGRLRPLPDPTQSTSAYLAAQRDRLMAQAELLAKVPLWYVAPFALGLGGVYLGFAVAFADRLGAFWDRLGPYIVGTALFLVFVAWLNRRASRRLVAEAARYEADAEESES